MNIPNALTIFRIILIPVFVITFYLPYSWSYFACAFIFGFAAVTDLLDGYLARKLDQSTPFGAFLDPVADKLMVVVALGLLIERFDAWYFTLPALVIIGREILISALREWMAEIGERNSVAVSMVGKAKTMLQMGAIFLLLCVEQPDSFIYYTAFLTLYVAVLLTLWSMFVYLKAAAPSLLGKE